MSERLRGWCVYWGAWALLGVYMATMDAVMYPKEPFFTYFLPMNLLQNLVWGIAGLGIMALARRWPLEHLSFAEAWVWTIHLFGSIVIAMVGLVIIWLISIAFAESTFRAKVLEHPFRSYYRFFTMYFHINLLLMWAVLGAFHGIRLVEKFQKRELEAAQLENRLSQAQNQALRMQLQPHFLFNTLNSISALIHSDGEAADRMLSRLADLLRMTLDSGPEQEIPLRQEMAFTDAYLAIEEIRFHDRLRVVRDIPADCLEAKVPAFILQPLVENAIKHGVGDRAQPSTLQIRARREYDWLTLEVIDDGRGMEEGSKGGIGTQNTQARLRLMYQDRQAFSLRSVAGQGTTAFVRIPCSRDNESS